MENNQSPSLKPIDKVCASLVSDAFKEKLQQALPPNISADKFCRTAINAIQMHPQQDKFNNCDTRTLFVSCQKAAADGLMLDGREGTLVAYWNKNKNTNDISYVPMVQGLVKAARNSGEIVSIDSHIVYQSDGFQFRPGTDPQPVFEPDWKIAPSKRGDAVLAYCVVRLKDGTVITPEPMHKERIMKIAGGGNNAYQYDPDRGDHWTEWWKKTAIKNALKYAPKSSELLSVENSDNEGQGFRFEREINPQGALELNEVFKPKVVTGTEKDAESNNGSPDKSTKKPEKQSTPSKAFTGLSGGIEIAGDDASLDAVINSSDWSILAEGEAQQLQEKIAAQRESFDQSANGIFQGK